MDSVKIDGAMETEIELDTRLAQEWKQAFQRDENERNTTIVNGAILHGLAQPATGRCDRPNCSNPAIVEDRPNGDNGYGLVLCATHYVRRNRR